jgi:hypothetical protein
MAEVLGYSSNMNTKIWVFEVVAPRAILFSLAIALLWSVVDFAQGGL